MSIVTLGISVLLGAVIFAGGLITGRLLYERQKKLPQGRSVKEGVYVPQYRGVRMDYSTQLNPATERNEEDTVRVGRPGRINEE